MWVRQPALLRTQCCVTGRLTCTVDAGHSVLCQNEVIFTVAHNAVLSLVAFTALTVAAVQHWTDDHFTIALHCCSNTRTHTDTDTGTHWLVFDDLRNNYSSENLCIKHWSKWSQTNPLLQLSPIVTFHNCMHFPFFFFTKWEDRDKLILLLILVKLMWM